MKLTSNTMLDEDTCSAFIDAHIPSRIGQRDETLFRANSEEERETIASSMGWTTLASDPPIPLSDFTDFVASQKTKGITDVVLVGQGGSTQAAMVYTKLCSGPKGFKFHTIDYLFSSTIDQILAGLPLETTLFLVASKSGSTVETLWVYHLIKERLVRELYSDARSSDSKRWGDHFVAITDEGSPLAELAQKENFTKVFTGQSDIGGRFSALSVFGLLPAACAGANINQLILYAEVVEKSCREDSPENPALQLACFLFNCMQFGRDKFSLITNVGERVFGLWVEQLIAESLGKDGGGLVPNIEVDPLLISRTSRDRSAISFRIEGDEETQGKMYELRESVPILDISLEGPHEVGACFVVWEYATAMLASLMDIDPFTQPDVGEAKRTVDMILEGSKTPLPAFVLSDGVSVEYGQALMQKANLEHDESNLADVSLNDTSIKLPDTLQQLFSTIQRDDYFALLSFIPFTQERRESLEAMRHCVAEAFGIVSCLEIAPRYLHSTGQLHKGGPNNGVFLMISGDTDFDIEICGANNQSKTMSPQARKSLNSLLLAEAQGDFAALSKHGRRVLHVHLPSWSEDTVGLFAKTVCETAREVSMD